MSTYAYLPDERALTEVKLRETDTTTHLYLSHGYTSVGNLGRIDQKRATASGYLVFDFVKGHTGPGFNLKIDNDPFRLGSIPIERLQEATKGLGKDVYNFGSGVKDLDFNYTALSYVLGHIAMRAAFHQEVKLAEPCRVTIPEGTTFYMEPNSVMIPKSAFNNDAELGTLLKILPLTGLREVVLMDSKIPSGKLGSLDVPNQTTKKPHYDLMCAYALRLQSLILKTANECGCAAHHESAFFRGMIQASSLRAHNDEGGVNRDILHKYNTCVPIGVLTHVHGSMLDVDTFKYRGGDTRRRVLSRYLDGVACVVAADPCSKVGDRLYPRVVTRAGEGTSPSAFPALGHTISEFYPRYIAQFSKKHGFVEGTLIDEASCALFLSNDNETHHLSGDAITPFLWVDPSAVCTAGNGPDYKYIPLGGEQTYKMWEGIVQTPQSCVLAADGLPVEGSMYWLVLKQASLRDCGAVYLLSGQFNKRDGLACFMYTPKAAEEHGHLKLPMYVDESAKDLASSLWHLWDNPIPHPLNGTTLDSSVLLRYVATGDGVDLSPNQMGTDVHVTSGRYRALDENLYVPEASRNNSKKVPVKLQKKLASLDPYGSYSHSTYCMEEDAIPYADHPSASGAPAPYAYKDANTRIRTFSHTGDYDGGRTIDIVTTPGAVVKPKSLKPREVKADDAADGVQRNSDNKGSVMPSATIADPPDDAGGSPTAAGTAAGLAAVAGMIGSGPLLGSVRVSVPVGTTHGADALMAAPTGGSEQSETSPNNA
jgi:hypothetical protein